MRWTLILCLLIVTSSGCKTSSCPVPTSCRVDGSDIAIRDELESHGILYDRDAITPIYRLLLEYRRVCEANEIDRE